MKAKSYKLKYVPTVQQLRDAGFLPGGSWMHENAFMFAERCGRKALLLLRNDRSAAELLSEKG
jgi:hypothetical protein